MKVYIAHFVHVLGVNKIQLIKLIRSITYMGLQDCKDFVEEIIIPNLESEFSLRLTEVQLGRYFIAKEKALAEDTLHIFLRDYQLIRFELAPESQDIDLTKL